MTTLQEASMHDVLVTAKDALQESLLWHRGDAWRNSERESERSSWDDRRESLQEAINKIDDALRSALAQQELPQKERPDFMAGYDAGMADAKRMAQQGEQQPIGYVTPGYFAFGQGMIDERQDEAKCVPVYAAAPAPQVTVEPGSVVNMGLPVEKLFFQAPAPQPTSGDYALGYAEGFNDACKPASQSAQDVPEVGFGNMPTKFLANGTRFKLSFDTRGKVSSLWNFMDELDGRWVALVAAEDDCHLQSAQPVAQPLAKTCDTCAHYQQGKHPGVRIHD